MIFVSNISTIDKSWKVSSESLKMFLIWQWDGCLEDCYKRFSALIEQTATKGELFLNFYVSFLQIFWSFQKARKWDD